MNITNWQGICRFFFAIWLLGCLQGCTKTTLKQSALNSDLRYDEIITEGFKLAAVMRKVDQVKHVRPTRIYLEGDGVPWRNNEPSTNPTGNSRLGFQLFLFDNLSSAYIARPCYEQLVMPSGCYEELWTSGRYSETVVTALTQAIEQIAPSGNIELVGYSGGGTLAALIAHRLPRVSRVLTLAANLDHDAWSKHHGTIPLTLSLNPVNDSPASNVAELHLFGSEDGIAPASLAGAYFEKHSAEIGIVDGFSHRCCWIEHWSKILKEWNAQQLSAP